MEKYSGRCRCEKTTYKISVNQLGKLIAIATGAKQQAEVLLDHLFYLNKMMLRFLVRSSFLMKIQKLNTVDP